jgi:hypothetical protein
MQKIVIVRDIKANVYGQPFFVASLGGAIRSFGDECTKKDGNAFALHPSDYELYHWGEYDEVSASFTPLPSPVQIALGSNFI